MCLVAFALLVASNATSQDMRSTEKALRLIVDNIVNDTSFQFVDKGTGRHFLSIEKVPADANVMLASRYNDWRYWNGVLNIAMIRLGEALNDSAYIGYAEKNVAFSFDNYRYFEKNYTGQSKWSYPFGQFFVMEELDDCGAMGASVIEVDLREMQSRYGEYIDRAAHHIEHIQPRLEDGTLVRSFPRKWTIWADDLYMSVSFLSRVGSLTGDSVNFNDAALQVLNFHKYLRDKRTGLLYHCWYSDSQSPGVAFWGRANGWAMVAQVDLLDRIPMNHPARDTLLALLKNDIAWISRYQGEKGLWHQLLDKPDSYLETSCSAMFTYTIARAVNNGYVDTAYASVARRGWEGVMSRIRPDGQVEGVCTGTAVGDDLEFYYKRPAPLNDVHGIGTVVLAGAEMLRMRK
jgi:unsaturated rhamnogalacturonyl hydrolase